VVVWIWFPEIKTNEATLIKEPKVLYMHLTISKHRFKAVTKRIKYRYEINGYLWLLNIIPFNSVGRRTVLCHTIFA